MTIIAWVSPLKPAHARTQLLFPIQSWGQGASFAALAIVMLALAAAVCAFAGDKAALTGVVLAGGLGGMLPAVYGALPAAFEVKSRGAARHILPNVESGVRSLGYTVQTVEQPGRAWRYRLNHPRWIRWRENEIVLRLVDEQLIEVWGTKMGLHLLRKRISKFDGFDATL